MSAMMKAYRVHEFGGPEVIKAEDIERPVPGSGEVLVRVAAAGVGPWDGWIRAGHSALPQPLPLTLGSDISGIVEALGNDVHNFKPGDAVYGVTNNRFVGGYAEYAIATAGMIALRPRTVDDIEAASIPVIAVTAKQALFDQAGLKQGNTVLVHGGAGNVGAYAVQLAHRAGLSVIATGSAEDKEEVIALGADQFIDYRVNSFEDVVSNVDAVIDLVGGEAQARSFAVLKKGGRLISAVSQPDQALASQHSVIAAFFLVAVSTAELNDIALMVDGGLLRTNVATVLPLSDAATAHEMLDGKRPRGKGKIVLRVA